MRGVFFAARAPSASRPREAVADVVAAQQAASTSSTPTAFPSHRKLYHHAHSCSMYSSMGRRSRRSSRREKAAACRAIHSDSSSKPEEAGTRPEKLCLVIECDGVLVDHHDCHRAAFNTAFAELGMDCTSWSLPVYHDLLRHGNGTAEGLIVAFYSIVGWPTMLATSDREAFVGKVHALKRKALDQMVADHKVQLRKGVTTVLDDAIASGAEVAILVGTSSMPDERLFEGAREALGSAARRVRIFNNSVADGEEASSGGSSLLTFEQSKAAAEAKVRRREAAAFVNTIQQREDNSSGMAVDPTLLAAGRNTYQVSPAWLAACMATLQVPLRRCALLGASTPTLMAAQTAGMLAAAVPVVYSASGSFAFADMVCDGFGYGGGATWKRVELALRAR